MENDNLDNKNSNKIKKIIKIILEWFLYIVIFVAIVLGTPKALVKFLHTDYPIASITSSSMWPTLKQGDIVFIRGYSGNKNDLKIGDIVVYTNDPSASSSQPGSLQPGSGQAGQAGHAGFTIHRIIELKENTLVTQGDANNVADPAVAYDQLVGKMIMLKDKPLRIPWLGNLSQMFKPK